MKTSFSILLFSLVLTSATVTSASAHSAIDPVPRNEPGWQERNRLLNQHATEAGDKAQVIGDQRVK